MTLAPRHPRGTRGGEVRLLLVVSYFFPEIGSAAHLYGDLARAFVKRGHEVEVITSYPREYNLPDALKGREFELFEEMDGVKVHRVRYEVQRDSIIRRGLEHYRIPSLYHKRYSQLERDFDAALIYIPPLPLYKLANRLQQDGVPCVLNIQDFHPQELVDVGVLRNPLLIRLMERQERKAYSSADALSVLSRKGIDYVCERGAERRNVHHIYNCISLNEMDVQRRDFKKKEGIEGKVLITYAGILSPFQGIDRIVDAASSMGGREDIMFYIIGDGMEREALEARVRDEKLDNVRMLPLQPREEYYNIINSSDISIISLDARMGAPCLPGKTINLLAVGRPIVAYVPPDSETASLMQESGAGIVVSSAKEMASAFRELADDPERRMEMGMSGRRYLEGHMTLERAVDEYEAIFKSIAPSERPDINL